LYRPVPPEITSDQIDLWHEVNWGGKKRYAATRCLEWGRVE
jgi:hypothetical protein